jgi:glutamate-1-semialdehyde 2,1-aminomutase
MTEKNYTKRLLDVIPGGAHTYSRGFDQYPSNAPQILKRGKGAYVFDHEEVQFLDYGMGLRAVNLGYSEDEIDLSAMKQIGYGNNLSRPSLVELQAAELLVNTIDSADMVKFTKNGSTAVSAAVKLARAYTGKDLIARCIDHPFFSFDDWFIGSTNIKKGIPQSTINQTKLFKYNDLQSLTDLIALFPNQISCVVIEPAASDCPSQDDQTGCCNAYPCTRNFNNKSNFLKDVEALCKKEGIVLILDEMITGFRWDLKGAQNIYGIEPDLCTFGKAMANGYSLACLAGKKEIMSLGSIEKSGEERVFLLSTTHGSEMAPLGAFVATVDFIQKNSVIQHFWEYGSKLTELMQSYAKEYGIEESFVVGGPTCSPFYLTKDANGESCLELRTIFAQEMVKNNVLMPYIAISYRHGQRELDLTERALASALKVYSKAFNEGPEKYLEGPAIKPVFRQFN